MKSLMTRFTEKYRIDPDTLCWEWAASTNMGYGQMAGGGGKPRLAHRVSWELHFGPVPDGLWVLHRCDNRSCVNPNHLFLGTVKDNVTDMDNKGRGKRAKISVFGENNGQSKLTKEKVKSIRSEVGLSQREIGLKYGVSRELIGQVLRNQVWKGV